ncbi:DUF4442 domain-containing protein [Penaeicola halotolerans]|uniref:DUF4442 domain-containing protein n=1 Tax=Penaeicola halotolerans TaxID=2793196 RepID=UPI001CF8BB0C|nr:DUF4442 domain-containing protein [Penaeicola halotolerans]
MEAAEIIQKAKQSNFHLWLLNKVLAYKIPFNKPHGFKITAISDQSLRIDLPYKRGNFNHIRGIHACALATLCEFVTGFKLIDVLGASDYRIILQKLELEYLYQAKKDVYAKFELHKDWLEETILIPLKSQEAVFVTCEITVYDTDDRAVVVAKVTWQIKSWQKVKTTL